MPGPPPKPNRQRRNKPVTAAELPSEAVARRTAKVPALPNRGRGKAWHPRTKRWWQDIWESPVATRYLKVHRDGLLALAELVDVRNKMDPADPKRLRLDAEIRMQRRDFGLTPSDVLRLGWNIRGDDKPPAAAPSTQQAAPPPPQPGVDPRRILRAV